MFFCIQDIGAGGEGPRQGRREEKRTTLLSLSKRKNSFNNKPLEGDVNLWKKEGANHWGGKESRQVAVDTAWRGTCQDLGKTQPKREGGTSLREKKELLRSTLQKALATKSGKGRITGKGITEEGGGSLEKKRRVKPSPGSDPEIQNIRNRRGVIIEDFGKKKEIGSRSTQKMSLKREGLSSSCRKTHRLRQEEGILELYLSEWVFNVC